MGQPSNSGAYGSVNILHSFRESKNSSALEVRLSQRVNLWLETTARQSCEVSPVSQLGGKLRCAVKPDNYFNCLMEKAKQLAHPSKANSEKGANA